MSLETWKEEFYPIDTEYVSEGNAVEHSLRKWIGLRVENLNKHGVTVRYSSVYDEDDTLCVNDESCALCVHHMDNNDPDGDGCLSCPLFCLLGRPCDKSDDGNSEYTTFIRYSNPEPMIAALEQLVNGKHNE